MILRGLFYFYLKIKGNTKNPKTAGSPYNDVPVTVIPFIGICTPVKCEVKLIIIRLKIPAAAFIITVLNGLPVRKAKKSIKSSAKAKTAAPAIFKKSILPPDKAYAVKE